MATLTITVSGPDLVMELLKRALQESSQTLIVPETIHPGYVVKIDHATIQSKTYERNHHG